MAKWSHFEILQKNSSNMLHVVWAEESKTGLGFETGPSYDDVPTASQCATAWQSSCSTQTRKYCLTREIGSSLALHLANKRTPKSSLKIQTNSFRIKNSNKWREVLHRIFLCLWWHDNLYLVHKPIGFTVMNQNLMFSLNIHVGSDQLRLSFI